MRYWKAVESCSYDLKNGKIKIKDFEALDELIDLCQDVMEKKDKAQPSRKKSTLIEE